MTSKYETIYTPFANQTLDWLPTDSAERYRKNRKERLPELTANGWIHNHFTYQFNSHGFRCDEFTNESSIMFLGCSHTCGIGLPVDSIWPELLAKKLNMRCANLGIGGSSMNTAFRLASGYIDLIKPKIVVCLKPNSPRLEIIRSDGFTQITPLSITDNLDSFYSKWLESDFNAELNSEKNLLAIQMLCHNRNIKFISYESRELIHSDHLKVLARDLMHYGAIHHQKFTDRILSEM